MLDVLKKKQDAKEFAALQGRFDIFSAIENVGKLETYFLPKFIAFTQGIIDLEKSNTEVREIVQ